MVEASKRFEMRVEEDLLDEIDAWRAKQDDLPNRSQAARRLIERGLKASSELFSPGEKLILLGLNQLGKRLKITADDPDLQFVADVIHGGHDWALRMDMPGVFHNQQDDPEDVSLVIEILAMWDDVERSFAALSAAEQATLEEKVGAVAKNPRFLGFDGNNEAGFIGITRFLIEKMERFQGFAGRPLNSHFPTLEAYTRMLAAYKQVQRRAIGMRELPLKDLEQVLMERVHPDRR